PDPQARRPNWFSRLAHPGEFRRWTGPLLLPLALATALAFIVGLWFALVASPEEYQMGDMVRVMYVHVPSAWLSQFVYATMAVSALGTLVWRHPLADVAARSAAPLGAARSEEHTSELQSRENLVCRLLLEKKNYVTLALLRLIQGHSLSRLNLTKYSFSRHHACMWYLNLEETVMFSTRHN